VGINLVEILEFIADREKEIGIGLLRDFVSTGSHLDYRMTVSGLFAFYLPRVLVSDRCKIEDPVEKTV
jgi:hypothetical protein